MRKTKKLIRLTTVPLSLQKLISGQMRYMSEHGYQVTMISSDFDQKAQLAAREQSQFIPVEMTRKITPFKDLAALYKLVKIFRDIRPDIVHTHTPKAGLLGMMAARISGVPIRLHTVAGLPLMETQGAKRILLEFVEKIAYACATKVYPNSANLRSFIIQSGFCNPKKLDVIGSGSSNGINAAEFSRTPDIQSQADALKSQYGLTADHFVFVFVGRLVRDKGIEELVQAFKILSDKYKQIRLLLVGPEEQDLDPLSESCLSEIKNNGNIIEVGFQADVRPFLAMSQVLAFPSYREGFPNVPMQAGCFDLPSIVTDINGCNEIVRPPENGLIIPVKNTKALTESMERLYTDKALYAKMATNARRMITERFDQGRLWEAILEEYNSLLNKNDLV